MCDYSIMHVDNRLAQQGETLATHRFGTGVVGLASADDLRNHSAWSATQSSSRIADAVMKMVSNNRPPVVCAICIPPGAVLKLAGIPQAIQRKFGLGANATVTFDQLDMDANNFRDGVRFESGRTALLQEFTEGISVEVVSLENTREREVIEETTYAHMGAR